ncbi:hypothetical protein HPB52_018002 [Rhipicephalus sanguineus]|uniref:RabBD domain-containing protein n=1 Tax=Rhipicephalus sanguineus TaxID=34632 RepID=A0A9D4PPB4_RHISA|nr:hypothetical protein HPB52_018002 [Rhipicephalus sanguineus]
MRSWGHFQPLSLERDAFLSRAVTGNRVWKPVLQTCCRVIFWKYVKPPGLLLARLECRLGGCAPSGCLAGPSLAASAVVRVAVGCGARVAACGNSDDGSWGPQHGRGPDADRKPAWGSSSAGGGGGVAAADRAWPRPTRLQQRPVLAGRVFMTAADAGGPGASGGALTIGGFGRGGGIIDPRAMDLDLSNLTLAEREAIMQVLQRDQALRKMEERRIL